MKRRRKFELFIGDLRRFLSAPKLALGFSQLEIAIGNLRDFIEELSRDAGKTRQLHEFAAALRASDAPGRLVAEGHLLEHLAHVARRISDALEDAGVPILAGFAAADAVPAELRAGVEVLRELQDFAMGCFAFKRARDSFGGRRRAHAFAILGRISRVVDLPTALVLARRSLRKPKSVEARLAAGFLAEYFERRGLSPDDDLTGELLRLAERAEHRSTATGALSALVETGTISEWEALNRLDDWKLRH
jgi:hypothetical protein